MLISTKGRYALRLMLDLAEHRAEGYLSIKEIAARQEISPKYLEAIVAMLTRAGLLLSQRGKDGGYCLSRDPSEIAAADILRCTEGSLRPVACASLSGGDCGRAAICKTLPLWRTLEEKLEETLSGVTLQSLLQETEIKES